ncbi:hypothetical protein ACJJTC_010685 [Scirpophaga incertulas]
MKRQTECATWPGPLAKGIALQQHSTRHTTKTQTFAPSPLADTPKAVAKTDCYSIVISTLLEEKEDAPDSLAEAAESGDDWESDANSECSGRASILPPVGTRTGVSKDLATERAREFYHIAKHALEESRNIKRELRAKVVEQASNLGRGAELAERRDGWPDQDSQAIHLVVHKETAPTAAPKPTPALKQQENENLHAALTGLKNTLGDLVTEVHYLKQDRRQTDGKPPSTPSPPSSPLKPDSVSIAEELRTLQTSLDQLREELREANRSILERCKDLHTEMTQAMEAGKQSVRGRAQDILRGQEEIKETILASSGASTTGTVGLGTELAAAETASKLEELITPLRSDVQQVATQSRDMNKSLVWINSALKTSKNVFSAASQQPLRKPTYAAQKGRQGTKTRGVALYMDSNTEELGIAFCNDAPKNVQISPGLGALLNGSTRKITLRRKVYDQMPPVNVENCVGRIVRKYNKTIVLFPMRDHITAFEQACAVLTEIGG